MLLVYAGSVKDQISRQNKSNKARLTLEKTKLKTVDNELQCPPEHRVKQKNEQQCC